MEKTGFQREKTQLQLESIKMVKEWSTWLAGLQTGICALLWGPLKDNPAFTGEIGSEKLVAGIWLYFAWYSFLISLVLTVLMLGTLPRIIEELRRAGKRQAGPFSKGPPKPKPKRPGRKPGDDYGTHFSRSAPEQIDETYDAELPATCPHCGEAHTTETHTAEQFQTEVVTKLVHRKFIVHVGQCDGCGRADSGARVRASVLPRPCAMP